MTYLHLVHALYKGMCTQIDQEARDKRQMLSLYERDVINAYSAAKYGWYEQNIWPFEQLLLAVFNNVPTKTLDGAMRGLSKVERRQFDQWRNTTELAVFRNSTPTRFLASRDFATGKV